MERFNLETGTADEAGALPRRRGLERIAAAVLLLLAFLLPVFFIPSVAFPFQLSKSLLLSLAVLLAFSLFVIARLRDGAFALPASPLFVALGAVLSLFVLSGLLSGSIVPSLLGAGFEVGTAHNLLILSLLVFLVSLLFRKPEQIFNGYLAFLASFFLIAFFHLLRLALGPDFLSAGVFVETVANTIGKWNDLGIFFGAAALLSLVTVELLSLNRLFRLLLYGALGVSLFFLALVNFGTLWFVLGLFSLVFLVYLISFNSPRSLVGSPASAPWHEKEESKAAPLRRIPLPSLFVLLVSVLFILAGTTIGRSLSSAFGISQLEARPSWSATFDVARQTLIEDPLLGAGPNQFVRKWLQFKPSGINQTIFWNSDFSYGVGLIPTFLVTVGILGLIAWAAFFLLFLYAGFRAILSRAESSFSRYLVTSSFLVSLFLWAFSVFYIPSQTIFALTFWFTGLFIAALASESAAPEKTISFANDPRAGFVSVLLLILLLIGGVTLCYALIQRYAAAVSFQRGVLAFQRAGDLEAAERLMTRAAALASEDVYFRFLSELSLLRMNALLRQNPDTVSAEAARAEFQTLLGAALERARGAVAENPRNYENFMTLGRVYEAVVPLGIEGAYESARRSYEEARARNPHSPAILLALARLESAKGDNAKAREEIARALAEKSNYTEAVFLLSQIEAREGNIKAAIQSAEAASVLSPNDATVFFQLGLLRWNDRNFQGAAAAFERATAQNPSYANAKYFLGLSYERLNRDTEALAQFTDLKAMNPDNAEVELILRNLKAGREPFSNAGPPLNTAPEKRTVLPVAEEDKER